MADNFATQRASIMSQLRHGAGAERLRQLRGQQLQVDEELEAIIAEAAKFSSAVLTPLNRTMDQRGCSLVAGRVNVSPGHVDAWNAFTRSGWAGIDLPELYGGQALASNVGVAVQEIFDRGCVAFGMVPGASRAAFRLLASHADETTKEAWLPRLATGEWAATICMSEAGAGSDVGRIRTRARLNAGGWRIDGEKMWISFADHSLTARIGHVVLARSNSDVSGLRGLSLFLVSSAQRQDERNGVVIRRVEEKLGLHGSATCAVGFEDSAAVLIGDEGRGVAQLFRMIIAMRMQVGSQGVGLATASLETALEYSRTRRQGGSPDAAPLAIIEHPDVRRVLSDMTARTETLRGILYAAAVAVDLADLETDAERRAEAAALLGWLLPIVKNSAAETAFDVSCQAMLVLGGAGYSAEWPLSQYLRDSRILAIYEGTTGMQAIDLVRRRILTSHSYEAFLASAEECRRDVNLPEDERRAFHDGLAALQSAVSWLRDPSRTPSEIDAAAVPMLSLASEVAHGWIAARLATTGDEESSIRLKACGSYALARLSSRLPMLVSAVKTTARRVEQFSASILQ
jgi:alkylation response protein AidB-like acyl-CoA dehydrogenase